MKYSNQGSYSMFTLLLSAVIALLLLGLAGCVQDYRPQPWDGVDSDHDTGSLGDAYADVVGLPDCHVPWVRLPPNTNLEDPVFDSWPTDEVHQLLYGDPDYRGGWATLYPVVYRFDPQDGEVIGPEVSGIACSPQYGYCVDYHLIGDPDENTQPFTLACAARH